jgi:hypothetical protein
MSMSDNEFFLDFKNNSAIVLQNLQHDELLYSDVSVFLSNMKAINKLEVMEQFLQKCLQIKEGFEFIRAILLYIIYELKWYTFIDCSSIFEFCQNHKGVFHLSSTSTIHEDLRCAKTLHILFSKNAVETSVFSYLEKHGEETGRGFKDSMGNWQGFKIADLMGYKSKLALLYDFVINYPEADIDFDVFFSKPNKEYKNYLKELLSQRALPNTISSIIESNKGNASSSTSTHVPVIAPSNDHAIQSSTPYDSDFYHQRMIRTYESAVYIWMQLDPFSPVDFHSPLDFRYTERDLQKPLYQYNDMEEILEELDPDAFFYFTTDPYYIKAKFEMDKLLMHGTDRISNVTYVSSTLQNSRFDSTETTNQDHVENSNENGTQKSGVPQKLNLPKGKITNYHLFCLIPINVDYKSNVLKVLDYIKRNPRV